MKDIKCKCSHLKSEHHKDGFDYVECNQCACSKYIRFDYPTKANRLEFYTGIVGILWVVGIFGLLFFELNQIGDTEVVPFSFFKLITISLFGLGVMLICVLCYSEYIRFYLRMKRRRIF